MEVAQEIVMTKAGLSKTITIDELRKHDTAEAPWFAIAGEVYDGTPFLKEHPGGATSIITAAGLDSGDEFMAIRKYRQFPNWRQSTDYQQTQTPPKQ